VPTEVEVAWFSGLFEGEGSFWFVNDRPKGLHITMTDEDVLLKVQAIFGGSINPDSRRDGKDHWKDAWKWYLGLKQSMILVPKMMPYLSSRRTGRGEEFLSLGQEIALDQEMKAAKVLKMRSDVLDLYSAGEHTQGEIAKIYGIDRTYVNKIIAGKSM
jgi:hypothetical protein